MELAILIAVVVVVSFAFLYVFRKQNKELKRLRKVSGRGGDFQE
jgi:septation ring formation regulator EzrA